MIKFIKIGNQISEWEEAFAFFDTVTDKFIEIGDNQVFVSRADLEECIFHYNFDEKVAERLRNLIPDDIKE